MVTSGFLKAALLTLGLLIGPVLHLFSQLSWQDDFSIPNFSQPKEWIFDTSNWMFSNSELQLNSIDPSPVWLSTASRISLNASWEFEVRMDFSPSSSNFCEIYLISDDPNPATARNAYFLRMGGVSGSSDDVSLYKKENGSTSKIIDGRDGVAATSSIDIRIRVERDSNFHWKLFTDTSNLFILEGSIVDSSIQKSEYFGFKCKFTSTRSDKFFFDDIRVQGFPFVDKIPIVWQSLNVLDSNTLELAFSEIPSPLSALQTSNYQLLNLPNGVQNVKYLNEDSTFLLLEFASAFELGVRHQLEVASLKDRSDNTMITDTMDFLLYELSDAQFSDVIFTEVMADPTPSVGLPEVEYLEIYNRSKKYIDLNSWSVTDPRGGGYIPDFVLFPNEYVILCDAKDTSQLLPYGKVIGIPNFPSINNSSERLYLKDDERNFIDSLFFDKSDYNSEEKENGGWSLELINPFKNCHQYENLSSSIHSDGGTPGFQNSILDTLPDQIPPNFLSYAFLSNSLIQLEFNEALDEESLQIESIQLSNNKIIDVYLDPSLDRVYLQLEQAIDSGVFYSLSLQDLSDCEGNKVNQIHQQLVLPAKAKPSDLVINEILFNPFVGGSDFLEVWNPTEKVFRWDHLLLRNQLNDQYVAIQSHALILPRQFYVLTEDPEHLLNFYTICNRDLLIETDLPSMNDEEGSIQLLNFDSLIIDHLYYHEDLHFPLLSDPSGVSLERIQPIAFSSTDNLFSASQTIGHASPTCQNSQYSENKEEASNFSLRKKIFSPDHDGVDDLLLVDYHFDQSGFFGTIEILDAEGRLIYQLINNELLAIKGTIPWNGIDHHQRKSSAGIYLLNIELLHPDGSSKREKIPFVLAAILE